MHLRNCLSLRLSELWNWWLVLANWWLVLADHFCQNWSWAIEKLWFWCLLSCLELPNDPQYVCTSCLGFLKVPNTSNGPYMISCFFRSAKSHFWAWWTDISHPMRQKNSPHKIFLQTLVNMIWEATQIKGCMPRLLHTTFYLRSFSTIASLLTRLMLWALISTATHSHGCDSDWE